MYAAAQVPKKRPEYRGDRSHLDFITKLSSHVDSVDAFEAAIRAELARSYDITAEVRGPDAYAAYRRQLEAAQGNFEPRSKVEEL